MNKKLKRKQALIMAEPYRTPFNSEVAKVSGDVIEDSVGGIKYATSFNGATKIEDANVNKIKIKDGIYSFGKSVNLIKFDDKEGTTQDGVTFSIKDGVITFSATPAEKVRNVTFHFNAIGINVDDTYSIALFNQFTSAIGFFVQDKGNAEGNIYLGINENIVKTWTVTTGTQYEAIVFYLDANKTYTNEVIKPILVSGSTIPTKYYSGSYGIKIEVADGVVTCNGMIASDSGQTWWYNFEFPIPSGIYSSDIFLRSRNINVHLGHGLYDWANSYQIATKEANTIPKTNINVKTDCPYMFFNFDREHDYDNLVLKPMLVLGTTAPTSFEPNFKNLLEFNDVEETTVGNFKYSIKNGIITINGTTNGTYSIIYNQDIQNTLEDGATYSFNDISNNNNFYMQIGLVKIDGSTQYLTKKNSFTWSTSIYSRCNMKIQSNNVVTPFDNLEIKPTFVKSSIIPTQFIPFANPYFVSLGQNGSVQYNGLEPREIDLKGNVISKINNQASDKLSNYALTKNTKVVDLGSLKWNITATATNGIIRLFTTDLKDSIVVPGSSSMIGNILCTRYNTVAGDSTYGKGKGIAINPTGAVIIYDPDYNTSDKLEAFKKAIRGTLLMYQVKNPTTINTTSFKTFKEDANATISDDNFASSPNAITETFKPTRSYDFKVNGFSNVVKPSNLLNIPDKANTTTNGVTYSIKDGVITLNGTTTGTLSLKLENIVEVEENQTYYFYQKTENTTSTFSLVSNIGGYNDEPTFFQYNNKSKIMTKTGYLTAHLYITNTNTTFKNAKFYLMLVEGDTAPTEYEPYFVHYIESFAYKKNLLDLSQISDIAFSTKDNQTITYIKGKNGAYLIKDYPLENGTYEVSLILKTKLTTSKSFYYIVSDSDSNGQSLFSNFQGLSLNEIHSKQLQITENKLSIRLWSSMGYQEFDFQMMITKGINPPTTFLQYQDKYSVFLNVKGKNLLNFENQSGTIPAGISYNVKNQVITLNGTAKDDGWVWFPFEATLNGTYSFKVITSKPISSSTTNKARISLDNPGIAGQVLVYLHQSSETTVQLNNFTCKNIGINSPINETWDDMQFSLILVEGDKIPEYEPYYSFTKEVLINQPLRKFDYLTYEGVYRQTNEITLDGSWNVVENDYLFASGWFVINTANNCFPDRNDWGEQFSKLYVTTTSDLPLISSYEMRDGGHKKGIAVNNKFMMIKLDDSADNSLNNWTVEKVNNYFKQNPITITYKTVDQTFEATSLTRLLFKNGYNKITPYDSINNNAIVEYLEYYKSKGD